ncbi:putative quinol monooxygenase [Vibrio ouci]|uniref:ABM domain-containing protein n=1 Tax=Vibrio ouci TaxID=2499078 RepID=A0A4Y8WC88_9VIBR|nr:antibiotic biosynthesis monooxygenase [Vibrio ouci]TFH90266.1 hypothetical protein ELS82_17645 [Vibrio ouci]
MSKNIVVFIKVNQENFKEFGSLLSKLREMTLAEEGCERFDTYIVGDEYVLIERWESQESIDLHMEFNYTVDFINNTEIMIKETRVFRLEDIENVEALPSI